MPDKLVRGFSHEEADAINAAARLAGQSDQEWMRGALLAAARTPIKARYTIKAMGPGAAHITISRQGDNPNGIGGGGRDMGQEQADAYQKAKLFVQRNGAGDRERAIGLLSAVFEEVFEVAG